MKEVKLPIEVQLVVRDRELPDTFELLLHLQDIVDQWYWQQIPTIPCGVVSRDSKMKEYFGVEE